MGIGVLAWGVANTGEDGAEASVFEDLHLPPPESAPTLTREQAIAVAGQWASGDIRAVDAQPSTVDAIDRWMGGERPGVNEETVWLIRVRGFSAETLAGTGGCGPAPGGPGRAEPSPTPEGQCLEASAVVDDTAVSESGGAYLDGGTAGRVLAPSDCNAAFSSDVALVRAMGALASHLQYRLPGQITVQRTSADEAVEEAQTYGLSPPDGLDAGQDVWLVTADGPFPGPGPVSPTPFGPMPRPFPKGCSIAAAIIDESGEVLFVGSAPSSGLVFADSTPSKACS